MNTTGDDDLNFLRASASSLGDLEKLIPRLLRKRKTGSNEVHSRVRNADLNRILLLIEPFQEDPQLLDTHLKSLIPPLVAAYLDSLHIASRPNPKKGFVTLAHAVFQILNLFCKVRGEKVIKGFLNNEPRYLEPILSEFEAGIVHAQDDDEPLSQSNVHWTERYVLLLWLSHLMLAPFPLASMSAMQSSQEVANTLGIELPAEAPGITLRVLSICVKGLQSASKERNAAAHLLVKLCVRPDMQKLGLLDTLVQWSLSFFNNISEDDADIHQCLGMLSFLSGLVTSATNEEIGPFLPAIYRSCQNIISQANLAFVKSSAVARKLVVKTLRNIVVHCLQTGASSNQLDTTTVLEEVIEFLLESLGDGDSPVRYAASKALSIVTMKLDPEMAGDVVEAILGSFNENVYWQGSKRNLSGVDSLRWHGLALTLSQLLYRRALSPAQLPDILNALLLALAFEQRSTTGGSIGTNVRDAACFGIWALSRRYTTKELSAVETTSVRASEHQKGMSILQVLAIELLVVACLDPAGNIRRGSSAALQELIGRHPNTIHEAIPLVQVVDFHAVGLRERAMCKVSIEAGKLYRSYWEALFHNLLGWRGIGSLDSASRLYAARAVGLLSVDQDPGVDRSMADGICDELGALKSRQVEERQGLVSALAALVDQNNILEGHGGAANGKKTDLTHLWGLLERDLKLEDNVFMSPAMRPDITASAVCTFLGALATMTHSRSSEVSTIRIPTTELVRLLNLCLGRYADSVLEAVPRTTTSVLRLLQSLSPDDADALVAGWLSKLENEASYNGLRWSGFAIALGAAYPLLSEANEPTATQNQIAEILPFRCTSAVAIEARTVALLAIGILLKNCGHPGSATALHPSINDRIASALHVALNDYTVTERGDVGSLVRLEALNTTGTAWETGLLHGSPREDELHADVLRMSLEKLDKVRLRAAHVLEKGAYEHFERVAADVADGVSSYAYFANALTILTPSTPVAITNAVISGYMTSAGMGSESVVQNARAALLDAVNSWPTVATDANDAHFNLLDAMNCLLGQLKRNLDTERVLIPLLEILAFLFDMHVMHRLLDTSFNFRAVLSYTQKAHFKSTHMQKLLLALDVYRGLGTIPATRADTITKVTSMLLHPFPNIRIAAAETLWLLTREESLKRQDWSLPSKSLKPVVEGVKVALGAVG